MATATMARAVVRITQERIPQRMLKMPVQLRFRFPAGLAGSGCVTSDGAGVAGTAAGVATGRTDGCAAGCVTGCGLFRGFPQFRQNWLVSGFPVPHSPQNIEKLRKTEVMFPCDHYKLPPVLEPLATRW